MGKPKTTEALNIQVTEEDKNTINAVATYKAPEGLELLIGQGREAFQFVLRAEKAANTQRMKFLKIVYEIRKNHFSELEIIYQKDFWRFLVDNLDPEKVITDRQAKEYAKLTNFLLTMNNEKIFDQGGDIFHAIYRLAHITDNHRPEEAINFQQKWFKHIIEKGFNRADRDLIAEEIKKFKQIADVPVKEINPVNKYYFKSYPNKRTIKVDTAQQFEQISKLLERLTPEKYQQVLELLEK